MKYQGMSIVFNAGMLENGILGGLWDGISGNEHGEKMDVPESGKLRKKRDFGAFVEMEYQGVNIVFSDVTKGHSQIREMRGKRDFGGEIEMENQGMSIAFSGVLKKDIPESGKFRKNGILGGCGNGISGERAFFFIVMSKKDIPEPGKCRKNRILGGFAWKLQPEKEKEEEEEEDFSILSRISSNWINPRALQEVLGG